ncbi:hypothetical protein [Halolamina sp. C58]|uniref:hypothetical protein n=1 Tax=Halolamina sp. C58 TaxID=3421640 RepID=UPI003EBF8042
MAAPSSWNRTTLSVASLAYAGILLLTVVEALTTLIAAGALFVFALSAGGTVRLADEHGLRWPAAAFFGVVALLLAAAYWRAGGSVDAFTAMMSHLLGLFAVAAVAAAELFLQELAGTRNA